MATSRVVFVIFVMLVLQTTVLANFTLLGVSVDLVLLIAFSAGVVAGAQRGAVIGFAAGLAHVETAARQLDLPVIYMAIESNLVARLPQADRAVFSLKLFLSLPW
ncbi:MAG: hypothetical protein ACERLM_13735, partial [Acidimicrobiales bacterium]